MPIIKADVEKIAELARLELTSEETEAFTAQLGSILGFIDKLDELDTSQVPPMSHCSTSPSGGDYAWRDDITRASLGQEKALENAPDAEAGYFKVPKVIG